MRDWLVSRVGLEGGCVGAEEACRLEMGCGGCGGSPAVAAVTGIEVGWYDCCSRGLVVGVLCNWACF